MGDDVFADRMVISTRVSQLTQLIQGKSNVRLPHLSMISQDGLLDALLVLHDECKNESLRANKHVQTFLDKASDLVKEVNKLRLSINDFDVKKVIGRGHFGEVQLVREKRTDNCYAMKKLRKCDTLSQKDVTFYEEERDIMAKATSPWLTKLEYAFQDEKNLYLCMEFHAGGDLLALLARYDDVFEESMARFYLAELTCAIHALHGMGYLHQDIKPENCLLDRTGHLKLADFGSAAKISQTHKVAFKMPVGTPDYVCPELLSALQDCRGRAYKEEVDWWSLGIVAYEFLFGVTPFTDPDGLVATTYSNIMNYQSTLEFPEDISVSSRATQFIKDLLTDGAKRLDFSGIFKHSFFSNIDFSRLREMKPPYIPTLKNASDTSNFDDFEAMKAPANLQTKSTEFSGRNLPFVGFTYTKRLACDRTSLIAVTDGEQNQNRLERKLTLRTKELQDVKGQVHALQSEDSFVKRKLTALEQALIDKEEIIIRIEKERNTHEKEIADYVTQITSLKRCLELEREARKESNRKAHESIQEIKSAMHRAQQLQEGYKNDQLDQHKEFIAELENERMELTQKNRRLAKELNFSKEKARELTERLCLFEREVNAVKEETKASLCEVGNDLKRCQTQLTFNQNTHKEELNSLQVENDDLELIVEELKQENSKLKEALDRIESDIEDKVEMMEKYEENEQKRKSLEIRLHELQQIQGVEQRLTEQLHIKGKRITELSEALTDKEEEIMKLEHYLKKMERSASRVDVHHRDQLRTLELKIQELDKERVDSEKFLKLEGELEDKEGRIAELIGSLSATQECLDAAERRIDQLERMNREREHDSLRLTADQQSLEYELNETSMEKDRLKAKIERLEKEVSESRNKDSEDRSKYLDLRIELRQLKADHETALTELKTELGQKTNALTDSQSNVKSLEGRNATLRLTMEEVRNALAESSHTYEQKILEMEREVLKLKSEATSQQNDAKRVDEMRTDLKMAREQCGSIKQQNRDLATELERVKAQKTKLENEVKVLNSQFETTSKKTTEFEKRCQELQQNTRMHKSDMNDRDARLRDYELKEKNWLKTKETMEKGMLEMEDEIDELSKRLCTESKTKQDLQASSSTLTKEVDQLREKFSEATSELDHLKISEQRLTVDLDHIEKEHSKLELDYKNVVRRLEHQEADNFRLREETSHLITEIKTLKASSFTLTQNLENAMDKYDNLNAEKVELENQLETASINFEHDKFKMDSTIAQQSKLISFLQSKTETPVKKKKTIFGAKAKDPVPLTPCTKAVQQSLEMEKNRNEELKKQIAKLKGEIHQLKTQTLRGKGRFCVQCDHHALPTSPKSTAALSALALSPSKQSMTSLISNTQVQVTPLPRTSRERMHHNIPHRFQNGVNTRATKCAVCLGTIQFVRPAAKCQECNVVCHPKCVQSLPASCGLPTQYMQHFTQVMTKKANSPARVLSTADIQGLELNGWMKLPRGGKQAVSGWEKKWIALEDDRLCIYDKDENDPRPLDTFNLFPKDAQVSVCSAVHPSELPQTTATDLPYILKLDSEPKSGNLPGRILYLMALSFNEKQRWVASLEALLSDDSDENVDEHSNVNGHTLFSFGLDMNCCLTLDNEYILLGCEEGLYAVKTTDPYTKPMKLDGLASVYELQRLGNVLVLICHNQDRELKWLDYRTVKERIYQSYDSGKASVLAKSIQPQKIQGVTIFQSAIVDGAECICLATTEKIMVLKYNQGLQNFGLRKEISTSEPCSCLVMDSSNLVIGTDKVYSITLDHYVMRELLDKDDKSLAFAVFGASSYESYPLAIHVIGQQYLLCFHEFGVFVDKKGRRARRFDLKWTGLPLSFAYFGPYLYVTYFNSIQVINLESENCFRREDQCTLDLTSPRFLGLEAKNGGIYISSNRGSTYQLISIQGSFSSSRNENKENAVTRRNTNLKRRVSSNARRLSFGNKQILTTSQSTLNSMDELEASSGTDCSMSPPKRSRTYNRY